MNQVLSKLKKDSLQDGKHTMGVSNRPSGRENAGEMHLFMGSFLFIGRPRAVLHNVLVFHP